MENEIKTAVGLSEETNGVIVEDNPNDTYNERTGDNPDTVSDTKKAENGFICDRKPFLEPLKRKGRHITKDEFVFNYDKFVFGETFEQFTDIRDLVLYYIKSHNGVELESYMKYFTPECRRPYWALRIPRMTVEAGYGMLKKLMTIKETKISERRIIYTITHIYNNVA